MVAETEQTPGVVELYVTARPEVAVAVGLTAKVPLGANVLGEVWEPKLIVWSALLIVTLTVRVLVTVAVVVLRARYVNVTSPICALVGVNVIVLLGTL